MGRDVVQTGVRTTLSVKVVTFFSLIPSVGRRGGRIQGIVLWIRPHLGVLRDPHGLPSL